MRRLRVTLVGCAALAAAFMLPLGGGGRPLPLHAPLAATAALTGIVNDAGGARLARVDPATFRVTRRSGLAGYYDGWVRSPSGKLLAVSTYASQAHPISTLRFANPATLRWARHGVRLDGTFWIAAWPSPERLLALVEIGEAGSAGDDFVVETVDTVAKKVVSRRTIDGTVSATARSRDGLVLLMAPKGGIGPAKLLVVGRDGSIRDAALERVRAGVAWPQEASGEAIGTIRQPGLAVDAEGGVAYVVDPDGFVAQVGLTDLAVSYHELSRPLVDRIAGWLTPSAQAKGANGPTRSAAWLGDGLLLVTGSDESAVGQDGGNVLFSSRPAGLDVVDAHDWSVRTIDPDADTAVVADGTLLATGTAWRSDQHDSVGHGVRAYGADGSLRWRVDGDSTRWVTTAYGHRAVIGGESSQPYELVDLAGGNVLRKLASESFPVLLLGRGS
jgi:hypothetical protein